MAIVQSHLRIDIAGGTLDLWPLHHFFGGAKTLNAAISLQAQAEVSLDKSSGSTSSLEVKNLNYSQEFKSIEEMKACQNKEIDLIRPVLDFYKLDDYFGLKIKTSSMSPVGGGLGGSSTLLVALLKAFDQELKLQRSEEDYINLASALESYLLKSPAGTQDYYQAVQPGLSVIHYSYDQRKRDFFKSPWLEAHKSQFILIDSGQSHHSGLNNWAIFQKVVEQDQETIKVLKGLKKVSEAFYLALQKKNLDDVSAQVSALLQEELELRSCLANDYVSETLKACIETLKSIGVKDIKICGAGGGGCLWALANEEQKSKLQQTNLNLIPCELIL